MERGWGEGDRERGAIPCLSTYALINMNVVMIVPTGIGCEIGGHCGDGNAPARLLGACCETLVLHPNVVNASDINEMPPNALYVEGNHLDRFLQGKLFLQKVKSNKVLVVVNKADYQSINAVSAARATLGLDAEILELKAPLNHPEHPKFIYVENYLEAAGMIMALKAGVHPSTVRRPLAHTTVRRMA